jgi:hypothetical protein
MEEILFWVVWCKICERERWSMNKPSMVHQPPADENGLLCPRCLRHHEESMFLSITPSVFCELDVPALTRVREISSNLLGEGR